MHPRAISARPRAASVLTGSLIAALAASVLTAAPATADAEARTASLTWSVKESFRDYLALPFVGGAVEAVAPATDDGTATTFPQDDATVGAPGFGGAVRFTGHAGELDVTIADPSIVFADGDASLYATVTTGDGDPETLELAALDLEAVTPTEVDGVMTYTDVPTTLTAAGVPAFSNGGDAFYEEGDALAPVTFSYRELGAPTVSVDRTAALDGAGDTLTVTGEGFLPAGAATAGTRPPLAGQFTGIYVTVGRYDEDWRPSEGAPSSARTNAFTFWALPADSMAAVGGASRGAIELAEDGSFTATFTVTDDTIDGATGDWGVYTYAAGGATFAAYETATAIAFDPRVVVSQTEDLAHLATLTVTGRNFLPAGAATTGARPPLSGAFTGVYVVSGRFAEVWQPSEDAARATRASYDTRWAVGAESMAAIGGPEAGAVELDESGMFTTTLRVEKAALAEAEGDWGVYTYAAGGAVHAPFETATPVTFADDAVISDIATSAFGTEISWLANTGITRGWDNGDGSLSFRPFSQITRDAMAAFLYRYAGSPTVELPETSPFTDVTPDSTQFYTEIVWMQQQGISTGWDNGDGTFSFGPTAPITRDAMAAFLYRFAGVEGWEAPEESPFADVTSTSTAFYDEITWLAATGITTGWDAAAGAEYRPFAQTKRDAMAAFLYRFHHAD